MAVVELTIRHEDNGGEGWLDITEATAVKSDGVFLCLDSVSLDILEAVLKARREGIYSFLADPEN